KHAARFISTAGVNRRVALFDVANDALLVNDESGAVSEALRFIENAVVFDHRALEITEYRESDAEFFRPVSVGGTAVYADAEDLCVSSFEFGDISLIRLHFLFSATSEREHVKSQHHTLLALEIAQLHLL